MESAGEKKSIHYYVQEICMEEEYSKPIEIFAKGIAKAKKLSADYAQPSILTDLIDRLIEI